MSVNNKNRKTFHLMPDDNSTSLPNYIEKFTNLEKLYLSGCGLTSLPEWIGKLTKLQVIDLMRNNLKQLPDSIGKLTNLKQLFLNQNQLTSLPKSIGNLTNLRVLDLLSNKLTKLPDSIGKLTELRELYLINNQLTSLPASIVNLTKLEQLNLEDNKLTSFPKSIGKLTELEYLNLDGNQLKKLPESIGNLTNLVALDLRHNGLTKLPEWIGKLTKLENLYLESNKLTSLPESIGNLTKLWRLYLGSSNELTSLPESIKKLKNTSIGYKFKIYKSGNEFFNHFYSLNRRVRVSSGTELITNTFNTTNKISNIPPNRRVYINKKSNVKNNGELRRLYNKKGINEYMRERNLGQLHGNKFNMNNVKKIKNTNIVNKNVYLGNIRTRLSNVPLNSLMDEVVKIKQNLPSNVSRNDVNGTFRNLKPKIMERIYNKMRNNPPINRRNLLNNYQRQGLINNTDKNSLLSRF
jgi:Leucine-rich repeat (LRR) protein